MVRNHSGGLPDEMGGYKLTRIAPNALPDRYVFTNDILYNIYRLDEKVVGYRYKVPNNKVPK